MSEKKSICSFCSSCHQQTNHGVLFTKTVSGDPNEYDYRQNFLTLECLGCENISFREDFYDLDSAYPDRDGEWRVDKTTKIFPSPLKNHKPIWETHFLPNQISIVYKEAIEAFKANCFLLTGVAFRAVIEAVCKDKGIRGRDLASMINNLATKRLITEKEADRLHSIRFIGNDSVHEMSVPKEEALYVVLNIVEHLLNNLYLIDIKVKGKIEMVVSEFKEFSDLLMKRILEADVGEESPLAKYLGKDMRLLNGRLDQFTQTLISEINIGKFSGLAVGKIAKFGNSKNTVQHFVVMEVAKLPSPADIW